MNKAVYTGTILTAIIGLEGTVVGRSSVNDVDLITIWYEEIDKKFTVKESNVDFL